MAPSSSHTPGSRAIRIPLHGNLDNTDYQTPSQRRRSAAQRLLKLERAESSDNGTGSSIGSDGWSHSPASPPKVQQSGLIQHAVASPSNQTPALTPPDNYQRKDKQRANTSPPNTFTRLLQTSQSPLGPSMLSSSAYKSINLNSHVGSTSGEPARLITYTKHSQGFTWNDELFLPSYMVGRHRYRGSHGGSSGARYRNGGGGNWDEGMDLDDDDDGIGGFEEEGERCPVTDIFVTDEEAAAMMP